MNRRLFKSMSLVVCISIIISYILIAFLMYSQFFKGMKNEIKNEASYVKIAMDMVGEDYLKEIDKQSPSSRFTLINLKGEVIFDSKEEKSKMANHLDRPEILQAIKNGVGQDVRLSQTLGEQTFYYAVKLNNNSILRVANTVDSVFVSMSNSLPFIMIIFLLVLCIAMIIAKIETKRFITPINKLDLENPLENDVYDELTPLLNRIHKQNNQINQQIEKLKERHEEFIAITENMQEGLILLDKNENILSINNMALTLFQVKAEDCMYQHILKLSRNTELQQVVGKAFEGSSYDKIVKLKNRYFSLMSNAVIIEGEQKGIVILILDVTEKQKSEKMRREFSANVSHELKTPLMSICGYAEIIKNNMVKNEDIPEFASRIYNESNRLTNLVEDIIKISKLDESSEELKFEEVDLFQVTQNVCENLSQYAVKNHVSVKIKGEHVKILGVERILNETIYNLCNNAIKYNKENGNVLIEIVEKNKSIQLIVSDTGIGIPKSAQERIFERFYRVDKSHSRNIDGTGLGLSIVKHGVTVHKANIQVKSEIDKGTSIKIIFKK